MKNIFCLNFDFWLILMFWNINSILMHISIISRRWVIKSISANCSNFKDLLRKESELVEKIAEVYIQYRNCILLIWKDFILCFHNWRACLHKWRIALFSFTYVLGCSMQGIHMRFCCKFGIHNIFHLSFSLILPFNPFFFVNMKWYAKHPS